MFGGPNGAKMIWRVNEVRMAGRMYVVT